MYAAAFDYVRASSWAEAVEQLQRLGDEAHADAHVLLLRERARLDALAHALLAAETLDEDDAYAAAGVPHAALGSETPATKDAVT